MNLEASQAEMRGNSICNPDEAKFVAKLAKYVSCELEKNRKSSTGGPSSVGILTFYNTQRWKIKEALRELRVAYNDDRHGSKYDENAISVRSVDGFQVKLYSILGEKYFFWP